MSELTLDHNLKPEYDGEFSPRFYVDNTRVAFHGEDMRFSMTHEQFREAMLLYSFYQKSLTAIVEAIA